MKTAIIIILSVILIAGGLFYYNSQQNQNLDNEINQTQDSQENNLPLNEISDNEIPLPMNQKVSIKGFAFNPKTITIKSGTTIFWTNEDSVGHTVTSDSGKELDSKLLSKEESYEHTFNTPGTYNYHCTPHPSMKGTIIVE